MKKLITLIKEWINSGIANLIKKESIKLTQKGG